MNRIAHARRDYRSQLRDQQAEATRARILDAAMRVMSRGIASLSVPEIAREAGVSVPTVYRHFGTKHDLLVSIYPHAARSAGLDRLEPPRTIDQLRDGLKAYFGRLDQLGEAARAAMASPAADEVRGATMADRLAIWRRLVDSVEGPIADEDRARLVRLLTVLVSSGSLRVWRDHVGASVEQAVDDVHWVINAAIAASGKDGP